MSYNFGEDEKEQLQKMTLPPSRKKKKNIPKKRMTKEKSKAW